MILAITALVLGGCTRGPKDVRYLESGKKFLAQKDYPRAALQFRNAIQANPRNAEAQYQLGLAEIARGNQTAAYGALSNALVLNPKHMDAQLRMAELLASSGAESEVREAKEHAQAVLNASPNNPDALDAMALAELRLGKREEGIELLERAASKAPEHLKTAVELAMVKMGEKDNAGAERLLQQAAEKSPGSLEVQLVLGSFHLMLGKNREGERELRQVLDKDPNSTIALLDLATMFSAEGRKDQAEEMYRRIAMGPANTYRSMYGTYLLRIGKQKEALAELERLSKLDPRDVNSRTRLVAAYVATSRVADAQRVLTEVLNKNPKDTAALLQRAELRMMIGMIADARKDLQGVLHYSPDSATAHFLMASVERVDGNLLKQRQELNETLRLEPRFFGARISLAQLYLATADGQSALDLMEHTPPDQRSAMKFTEYRNWALLATGDLKTLQKEIDEGLAKERTRDLLMQDALLRFRQGNHAAGRSLLAEVLRKNPEDLGAVDVLIRSYVVQKELPAAIEKVRGLAAGHPKSAPLRYRLGLLLGAAGRADDAREAFTAALVANPQYTPPRLALAVMDRNQGKSDAARQELDKLLSSKTGEFPARMELGFIEAKAGNYPNAIAQWRKVVEAQPKNVVALNNLAYLLADHDGKPDEALKYAQTAKELAPNDVTVEGTLGWVFYQKGLYSLAVQHLQEAVNREGKKVTDGTAIRRYHLAMAYHQMGDQGKAAATLNSAVKLDSTLPEAQMATRTLQQK